MVDVHCSQWGGGRGGGGRGGGGRGGGEEGGGEEGRRGGRLNVWREIRLARHKITISIQSCVMSSCMYNAHVSGIPLPHIRLSAT